MGIFERMQKIDRRWIYLVIILTVAVPLVKPFGLPIGIRPWSRQVYEKLEALNAGDKVVIAVDYAPSMMADIHPQLVAVWAQLMEKNVKIVGVSFVAQGVPFLTGFCAQWEKNGKTYGVDFVDLGFIPGGEAAISAFAANPAGTIPKDTRGNETSTLPIMNGIETVKDVKIFLGFSSGSPGPKEYIHQLQQYNVPIIAGLVTVSSTEFEPYVQSGQLAGILPGLRGAAEYEALTGNIGVAASGMDAQSTGHLALIAFVLLCNIGYLGSRKKSGGGR